MNKILSNGLITVGFCVGTVGAIGFDDEVRPYAWPMFLGGLAVVAIVGLLDRLTSRAGDGDAAESHGEKQRYRELIDEIRDKVIVLDEQRTTVDEERTRHQIDHLLANEYFDLTSQNEELIALIGFNDYAKVWEGIATAERLLARAWSMSTDGYADQGYAEIPRARARLEQAAAAMAEV